MTDGVAMVEKSGSWQLSTNFPLSSWDGDLSNMPHWRWRYPIGAAELERKNGLICRDDAMGILASIAQEKTEVMPWETVFSVVYTPEGSVDIVMNREWSTVHRFHINSL